MAEICPMTLYEAFQRMPDPRHRQGRRHSLAALLSLATAAMAAGNASLDAIAQWGRMVRRRHHAWWRSMGFHSYRSPSSSTLSRTFRIIDTAEFETILAAWVAGLRGKGSDTAPGRAISLDGKTLRGSRRVSGEVPGVHLLSAYQQEAGCVLAQCRVDEKTNEPKAALDLLNVLILREAVLVGDAIFCQKEMARAVREAGGDYFLVVKDNQASLKEAVATAFEAPSSPLGTTRVAG